MHWSNKSFEAHEPETKLSSGEREEIRNYLASLALKVFGDDFVGAPTPFVATKTVQNRTTLLDMEAKVSQIPETLGLEYKDLALAVYDRLPYLGEGNFEELLDGQKLAIARNSIILSRVICLSNSGANELLVELDYSARANYLSQDGVGYYNKRSSKKILDLEAQAPVLSYERFLEIKEKADWLLENARVEVDDDYDEDED